jgi:hypothetical protein
MQEAVPQTGNQGQEGKHFQNHSGLHVDFEHFLDEIADLPEMAIQMNALDNLHIGEHSNDNVSSNEVLGLNRGWEKDFYSPQQLEDNSSP